MGKRKKQSERREEPRGDGELDDETLDDVAGGATRGGHELTHTEQQSSSIGANQTLTIGANKTTSVGGD